MKRIYSLMLAVMITACADSPVQPPATPETAENAGFASTLIPEVLDARTMWQGSGSTWDGLFATSASSVSGLPELEARCENAVTGNAFDGDYYYAAEGGGRRMCVSRYDAGTGELLDHKLFWLDFRGLHYTPATGLVGRSYRGSLYAIDYEAGSLTRLTSFNAVPENPQTPPAVDPDGVTYWYRDDDTIVRRNLADGAILGSFPVVPATSRIHGMAVGTERVMVPNGGAVEVYDKETGEHLASKPTISPAGCSGYGFGGSFSADRVMYDRTCSAVRVEALVSVIAVQLDIKPDSDDNTINVISGGVTPAAVLNVDGFDPSTIDLSTLSFGPGGATPAHGGHLEDVDEDGDLDLLLHFRTAQIGLTCDATEIALTGETVDGDPIEGGDSVNVLCRGTGPRIPRLTRTP